MKYLIYNFEREAWWNASKFGYTKHIDQAGRFSEDEAKAICIKANTFLNKTNLDNKSSLLKVEEAMVPISE